MSRLNPPDGPIKRNRIQCLECKKVLESKSVHHYVKCGCPNKASTDGGRFYYHIGAMDLNKVRIVPDEEVVDE